MKKGFTLVELLAVLAVIGVVALIVFPAISASIKESGEKLYQIQVEDLEQAAKKWSTEHNDLLDHTHLNSSFISIKTLKDAGYIESMEVRNPKDKSLMTGCIRVYFDETKNSYAYHYEEKTCENRTENGWIYTYQNEIWQKTEKDAIASAADTIVKKYMNDNLIKTEGQITSGLYDMGSQYVFRGGIVDNYAKINGTSEVWRILSMDKNNHTIRLLSTSPIPNAWDTENKTVFENASVSTTQLDTYYQNQNGSLQKIRNKVNTKAIWNAGTIVGDASYSVLKSLEAGRIAYAKLGLLHLSDYVGASTNATCQQNYASNTCQNENYLATLTNGKTTWTINTNGNSIWVIDGTGMITTSSPSSLYYIYPVVELKANAYIMSGDGKQTSPYILS